MPALKKLVIKDQIAPPKTVIVNGEEAHIVKDQNDNILWAKRSINLEDDEGDLYDINNLEFETDGYWDDLDSFLWNCLEDYRLTISAEDSTSSASETDSSHWAATDVPANRDLFYIETSADVDFPSYTNVINDNICAYEGESLFAKGTLSSCFYNEANYSDGSWGDPSIKQELTKNSQGNYCMPTYSGAYSVMPKWCYLDLVKPSNSTLKRASSWVGPSGAINDGDKIYYRDILQITSASDTPKGYYPTAGTIGLSADANDSWLPSPGRKETLDITPRPPLYLTSKPTWTTESIPAGGESNNKYIKNTGPVGSKLNEVSLEVNPFFKNDLDEIQSLDIPIHLYTNVENLDLQFGNIELLNGGGKDYYGMTYISTTNLKDTVTGSTCSSYLWTPFFKNRSWVTIKRPAYYEISGTTTNAYCSKCYTQIEKSSIKSIYCACGSTDVSQLPYGDLFGDGDYECNNCGNTDKDYIYFDYYWCPTCKAYHHSTKNPIKYLYPTTRYGQPLPTYCYLTYVYDNNLYKANLLPSSSDTKDDCTLKIDPVVTVDTTSASPELSVTWVELNHGDGTRSRVIRSSFTNLPTYIVSAPLNQTCSYFYEVSAVPLDHTSKSLTSEFILVRSTEGVSSTTLINGITFSPQIYGLECAPEEEDAFGTFMHFNESGVGSLDLHIRVTLTIDDVTFTRSYTSNISSDSFVFESDSEDTWEM